MKKKLIPVIAVILILTSCGNAGNDEAKNSAIVSRQDSIVVSKEDTTTSNNTDTVEASVVNEPGKEVMLQFNLEKGRSYGYDINMEIAQEVQERKLNSGMNWKYNLRVMEDNKKEKLIKVTYDRIAISMDMGGQKMEFSSDAAPADPSNPLNMVTNLLSAMKGKSFTMTVNAKGEIGKVEGFDQLGEDLVSGMKLPAESKGKMLQSFRSKFNANDVKETFAQTFSMLPGKKVKAGDSWEKESATKLGPTKGKLVTVYTVQSVNGGLVKLIGKGKLLPGNGTTAGTQNSRMTIDAATGLVLQNVFDIKAEGPNKITSHGRITGKKL